MTQDDIRLLFEYDRWANDRSLRAASALSPEQFTRDLGGAFRSVRDTLVHIAGGQWIWLNYWREPSPSAAFLAELRARRDGLFHPNLFPDAATLELKWAELQKDLGEFVSQVTGESLERLVPFRTTHVLLAHLMQHLANHATYHRGQVALMMRQLGAEPLATDFHVFLVEGRQQATTAH